jgi:hypothetical protein
MILRNFACSAIASLALVAVGCTSVFPQVRYAGFTDEQDAAFDENNPKRFLEALDERNLTRQVYEALECKLGSGRLHDQFFALIVLGRIPNRGQYVIMEQVAKTSPHIRVRCQAMYCTAQLRDPASVPYLLKVARSGKGYERLTAVDSLDLVRTGIVDDVPLFVDFFVFERPQYTDEDIFRLPDPEEVLKKFEQWWNEHGVQLLGARRLDQDYWSSEFDLRGHSDPDFRGRP